MRSTKDSDISSDLQEGNHRDIKLGIFFSHPTQHHSTMFRYLSCISGLRTKVYYYDPGSLGGMFDSGYSNTEKWDVDLLTGTESKLLANVIRGKEIRQVRQINPGVVEAMLREKFDAVFLSGYASPSNWLVLTMAKLLGVHILYQADTNILDERRKPGRIVGKARDIVRRIFLSNVGTFLVIGDLNRRAYLTQRCSPRKMLWCPCPVDVDRFRATIGDSESPSKVEALRVELGIPASAKVVIFCGKLSARKRPQDFIEAARLLRHECQNSLHALIVGSGPMEEELRSSLRPGEPIHITGFVNQSVIPLYMMLADVAVVTSEWDPHPLVTTEFAACGLPVVVSHYCGVWGKHDILQPGENGYVYRCGDVRALASRIARLLDDNALRARMGKRSAELAQGQSARHAAELIASHLHRNKRNR
jgi:glycosyltransferase involved in cell wall biosynthesis